MCDRSNALNLSAQQLRVDLDLDLRGGTSICLPLCGIGLSLTFGARPLCQVRDTGALPPCQVLGTVSFL